MIASGLAFLERAVRPQTVYFLFLMSRFEFHLNYPLYCQPSFLVEMF